MDFIKEVIILYFLVINLVGFLCMGVDKKRAKDNKWRIKEKNLFMVAIIGGSVGSIFGMKIFHHKTKHKIFIFGMPFILVIQILLIVFLYLKVL